MPNHIPIKGSSDTEQVTVQLRNTQPRSTEAVSATLPVELLQTINGIVVKTEQSRSKVIADLIADGLKHRQKGA